MLIFMQSSISYIPVNNANEKICAKIYRRLDLAEYERLLKV